MPTRIIDFTECKGYNYAMSATEILGAKTRSGIDLHAHTTASDGSLTPTELVRQASALGLSALAVTDHDTLGGLAEAMAVAREIGLGLLPGVELSVEDNAGRFHLLGYGFDPQNSELAETLIDLRRSRAARNEQMAKKMAALGLLVTMKDVRAVAGEDAQVIARPHFAQALVNKGVVSSVKEAFDRYLSTGKPLYQPKEVLTPADAIALLHRAGGVAVMAHPGLVPLSVSALAERIASLHLDAGMDGLEALYSQHSPAETEHFLGLARQNGLLVTGGSDFHGTPKPHVPLGVVFNGLPAPCGLLDALQARLALLNAK
jgi:predicted metal-dependent phosphoesterase TrpH